MKKNWLFCIIALCMLCVSLGALASEAPSFDTFGDAVKAAGEDAVVAGSSDYTAVIVQKDGEVYRVVTFHDDKARQMDEAVFEAEDFEAARNAFYDYVYSLPVDRVEKFTAKPKDQAELDALAGKTIAELEQMGFITSSYGSGGEDVIEFDMSDGLYEYTFVVDADYDTFERKNESDEPGTLVVVSGRYARISNMALNLYYHADGTVDAPEAAAEPAAQSSVMPAPPSFDLSVVAKGLFMSAPAIMFLIFVLAR